MRPTVLVEIGNIAGGSAFYLGNYVLSAYYSGQEESSGLKRLNSLQNHMALLLRLQQILRLRAWPSRRRRFARLRHTSHRFFWSPATWPLLRRAAGVGSTRGVSFAFTLLVGSTISAALPKGSSLKILRVLGVGGHDQFVTDRAENFTRV